MTHFEIELEKLRKRIIDMGSLVEKQLSDSLDAMINGKNYLLLNKFSYFTEWYIW